MKTMNPAIRITRLPPPSVLAYASGFDTRAGFKIRGRCISRTLGSAIYDRKVTEACALVLACLVHTTSGIGLAIE